MASLEGKKKSRFCDVMMVIEQFPDFDFMLKRRSKLSLSAR